MPILERDPWRFQFFDAVACPADVNIPTDDPDAWALHPEHNWIYDKLRVAQSQGLICGPHAVPPPAYPIFSKPIINLKGMGVGSRPVMNSAEMAEAYAPGHMWMPLLEGPHVSTDCAVVEGRIRWMRHATGLPWTAGMFQHWTIHADLTPEVHDHLSSWVAHHMGSYTGMMNFETIGGRIIETHLRFADQWCDLYGPGWCEALVRLYDKGVWSFDDTARREGYSVPLFASHGGNYRHPSLADQQAIRSLPHVKSLQITFHETKSAAEHAMPPGGFRLGIVNCTDLAAGQKARQALARLFPEAPIILPD